MVSFFNRLQGVHQLAVKSMTTGQFRFLARRIASAKNFGADFGRGASLDPRDVGVTVQRDSVHVQRDDPLERAVERSHRLFGKPVEHIHVYALDSAFACAFDRVSDRGVRLHPPDRSLNPFVQVLLVVGDYAVENFTTSIFAIAACCRPISALPGNARLR